MKQLIRREPLIHFLLIALLLFIADGLLNGDRREEIRVDADTLDFLAKKRSERELRSYLGEGAATTVFAIADQRWHGPIHSVRGNHFVRVTERLPTRQADFETIADYLVPDWQLSQQKAAMADKVAAFRNKYRIITPPTALAVWRPSGFCSVARRSLASDSLGYNYATC